MSKLNKYVIVFLALLIACMSVAVAADSADSMDVSADDVDVVVSDSTTSTDLQVSNSVSEDNNLVKETKNVKTENSNYVDVTTDTQFNGLFDDMSTGVHQIKSQYSGYTIKINTDITKNEESYIINVPITLTSDYNNTIDLNSSNGYNSSITEHWTSLNFTSGASGSRINNMQFHNTQIFVLGANDIEFNQITVKADQPFGKGTGLFSIRSSSTEVDVTNSYFDIDDNDGISVIALTNAEDCLIDHNNIEGEGKVGNLIYLNTYFYNANPAPDVTNRHNTISYNTLTGPTTAVNTCFAIAIAGPDNTIEHNNIYYGGVGITTNWQGSYDEEIIELDENDFVTVYEGNKYYYNNLYNGASFQCGNYSIVENNYITGTSNFAGHSDVTSNTLLNTTTVHNNVRFHSNTATGQTVNVNKPNSCFKNNVIGELRLTTNKAQYTYNCGGNTIGSIFNTNYFITCSGNCPNCASTMSVGLSGKSNKQIKTEDSNVLYSDDELTIYNNATAVLVLNSRNAYPYMISSTANSHINEYDIRNIVIYINDVTWGKSINYFGINLGNDKSNIDLTIISNTTKNIATGEFKFITSGYKSITYENCKFNNNVGQWGVHSNLNFINCSFTSKFDEPGEGISISYYFTELTYVAEGGWLVDDGATINIMSIVGENLLFERCTFDLKTCLPYIDEQQVITTAYTNLLVFNNSNNVTFDNNTFTVTTAEADSSIDSTLYGPLLNRTVNNLKFINNEVSIRYARGIMLKTNNSLFENNTIMVANVDNTIVLTGDNNTVHYNTLTSVSGEGDVTVITNGENNIVEQNPYVEVIEPLLKVDTTEFTSGTQATIKASIYLGDEVMGDINKGKVTFKVNGKTLKDASGKVIYAKVTNGVASIEGYEVPQDWKEGSTIQAVYSGSSDLAKMSSETTNITITSTEVTIETEDITANSGSTINLTATITSVTPVNTAKVVFKINGKTVKDESGKVIYAKVVNNHVNFEYTLPENMAAGTYNITATLISADYGKLEDSKSLTVTN